MDIHVYCTCRVKHVHDRLLAVHVYLVCYSTIFVLTLSPSMREVMFGGIQPGPRPVLWALPPAPTFRGSLMRIIPYQMPGIVRVGPAWNHIYA